MWVSVLTGKRPYCNRPLLGHGVVEWWKVGLAGGWQRESSLMDDPTDGRPDLHWCGFGHLKTM